MNMKSSLFVPRSDSTRSGIKPDTEFSQNDDMVSNATLKFDNRLLRLVVLLKEIHQRHHPDDEFSMNYLVKLFENHFDTRSKSDLITEINLIGYEKLKNTFEKLNQECESYLCESEDIFGILKRHQFNKSNPETDYEKLRQVIQFMHITLIHINLLHNKRRTTIPGKIIILKNMAFDIIESIVNKIEGILIDIAYPISVSR